ncbi:hypothetical protein [Paenibacillus sp. GXUN7292]|uniref:hypothetical protein n=1 Tax=Paenibacillus sp. GXUN7292 TaxID=3422499 RepID=UPI003D7EA7B1
MYWNQMFDEWLLQLFEATPGGRLFYLVLLIAFFISAVTILNWVNARSERRSREYEEVLKREYERKKPIGAYYWVTGDELLKRRKGNG